MIYTKTTHILRLILNIAIFVRSKPPYSLGISQCASAVTVSKSRLRLGRNKLIIKNSKQDGKLNVIFWTTVI